mgnify:CR=1 FL=1
MEKFTKIEAIAAPLLQANIDTDAIIPKDYLKTTARTGLGKHLFHDLRYDDNGEPLRDFVLNAVPYNRAEILLTGSNFGCGSSREHAPWALLDFGIRAVIAPSFADIFFGNCFKNGICPVVLAREDIQKLADVCDTQKVTVDLEKQHVSAGNMVFSFDIDPIRKKSLLLGLDDIGLTLEEDQTITRFTSTHKKRHPWL